ncbi:aaa family atpase [Neofusicoccum parvum]|uniref:Aaa family atpase n=1 Tax=Neofusicoccum parvum TaxID=310453 RepID=A0ACB5S3D6_9PEZI|nr:aaa family atpase [Neofusicoccum parvum]
MNPSLKPMDPDPLAWNDLKLPNDESTERTLESLGQARKGHKNIIKSLVDKHFAKDMEFDLVRDKGRGLIVLLHGVPGVGKTSTAECVAMAKGRPLLPITCGDLGLEPEKVEANLSRNFELAQAWDCILLLDEADVFLASRSLQDLQRNALVSVFLRILEYYEGILFLTTNRVGHIDEAFKSRIHMALYYPPLTEDQTLNIWKTLMRKAREAQKTLRMDENTLSAFAMKQHFEAKQNPCSPVGPDGNRYGWNGRQIRNAFMSAIAIAQYEAQAAAAASGNERPHVEVHLNVAHFKTVSQASDEFEEYLWRTRGKVTYSTGAENEQIRYDRFDPLAGGYPMRPQQSQQTQQRSFHQQSFNLQPQPPMQHQQFSQPSFTTGVQNQGYGSPAVPQGYHQHMSSNPQGYYPAEGGQGSTPGYANQPQYAGQNPGQMMPPPQPQQGMPL